jgi:hypothetical protein
MFWWWWWTCLDTSRVKKKPTAQTTVCRRLGSLHARYGASGVCWTNKRLNLIFKKNKLGISNKKGEKKKIPLARAREATCLKPLLLLLLLLLLLAPPVLLPVLLLPLFRWCQWLDTSGIIYAFFVVIFCRHRLCRSCSFGYRNPCRS